jgi:hypothetical protein
MINEETKDIEIIGNFEYQMHTKIPVMWDTLEGTSDMAGEGKIKGTHKCLIKI